MQEAIFNPQNIDQRFIMQTISGISKKESIEINLGVAVSREIRHKITSILDKIMNCDNIKSLVKLLDYEYEYIPVSYLKKSEILLVSKKYCELVTVKHLDQSDKRAMMDYVHLKQDIDSIGFTENLSSYVVAETHLDAQIKVIRSSKILDEKLKAARNCMNEVEPFMTTYEKLLCRQVILLSGNDPYFNKWRIEAVAMYQEAMKAKDRLEKIFSSKQVDDGCVIVHAAGEKS